MSEAKVKELELKVFDLEKKVATLESVIAKWRYQGLRGLDTGSSLGDILSSTGDLTVDGTLTIDTGGSLVVTDALTVDAGGDMTVGTNGAIRWGTTAEHSIEGNIVTFQNGALTDLAGRIKFRSTADATRRSEIVGYFGDGAAGYPICVLRAGDTDLATEKLSAWIGVGADFNTGSALADMNVSDTGGVTRTRVAIDVDNAKVSVFDSSAAMRASLDLTDAGAITILSEDAAGADVAKLSLNNAGQVHVRVTSGGSFAVIDSTNSRTMLEVFPGGNIVFKLSDASTSDFNILDSAGAVVFAIQADGTLTSKVDDATGGAGAYSGRIPIVIGGTTRYLRHYAS